MAAKKKRKLKKTGTITEKVRQYQADYMRDKRAEARDIEIDFSKQDMKRRARCRKKPELFLRTYFPRMFFRPFSSDQKYLIKQIAEHIRSGGMKAIAAPRAGGKTTISKGMVIWGLVYGYIRFIPWIEANKRFAKKSLKDIKLYFDTPNGDDLFRDDFPEYCDPIRALRGQCRLCATQTYAGKRTNINWGIEEIALPTIEAADTPNKTAAIGGIITAIGAGEATRGLVHQDIRPDFAMLNDVETKETAASVIMTETIREGIESDVRGLKGHGQKLGIVMLCTIIRRGCLSDIYTNIRQSPQWSGTRQRYIIRWPDNQELWDRYIYLRKKAQKDGDKDGRIATKFYRDNRKAMDAGAVVSNKYWFESGIELSALQAAYDYIADFGREKFDCEYQNEPPEDSAATEAMPTDRVTDKLSGVDRGVVPSWAEKITAFVDVHNEKLFWSIAAWKAGMTGAIVDYGVDKLKSPTPGEMTKEAADKAVDIAIYEGLVELRKRISEKYKLACGFVDSGWRPAPVFRFCRESVGWMATKGGSGPSGNYTTPKPDKLIPLIGQGFHVSVNLQYRQRQIIFDPDWFKKRVHEAFLLTDAQGAGSLSLFGDEPTIHRAYSEHIAAEQWDAGKMKFMKVPGKNHNHWLDCAVGCMVAAALCGIKLVQSAPVVRKTSSAIQNVNAKTSIRTHY